MLLFAKNKRPAPFLAFMLKEEGLTASAINHDGHLLFSIDKEFKKDAKKNIPLFLAELIDEHQLIDANCHLILNKDDYQIVQTDALDVPEDEMTQAIRWNVNDLIDYKQGEYLLDTFLVPEHGLGNRLKKVFVAATPIESLKNKLSIFEEAFLNVKEVTITELILGALAKQLKKTQNKPYFIVAQDGLLCQLSLWFEGDLYLLRNFNLSQNTDDFDQFQKLLLEIQRSIDYTIGELKLLEPAEVLFTPAFYQQQELFLFLKEQLGKEITLMDLNLLFPTEMALSDKQKIKHVLTLGCALYQKNIAFMEPAHAKN